MVAKTIKYQWECSVCAAVNRSGTSVCNSCGNPSNLSSIEVDAAKRKLGLISGPSSAERNQARAWRTAKFFALFWALGLIGIGLVWLGFELSGGLIFGVFVGLCMLTGVPLLIFNLLSMLREES